MTASPKLQVLNTDEDTLKRRIDEITAWAGDTDFYVELVKNSDHDSYHEGNLIRSVALSDLRRIAEEGGLMEYINLIIKSK